MSARVYELHGLRVRSELPLDGPISNRFADPDWDVRFFNLTGEAKAARNGSVLAQLDEVGYSLTAIGSDEYVIRFGNEFEYQMSYDRRIIEVRLYGAGDPEGAAILLAGSVLSCVLALQGKCVLHASAIQTDGWTLAIVGASGMGKSTLTALFCAAGAQLVSDDVLRLESWDRGIDCFAGTSLIRLRPTARELAGLFPPGASRNTSDGRLAVQAKRAPGARCRVDAMLIPKPSHDARELCLEQLGRRDALVELLRYPRMSGWHVMGPTRRLFEVVAEAVNLIPVYTAEIPWGPPFDRSLPRRLLEGMGLADGAATTT